MPLMKYGVYGAGAILGIIILISLGASTYNLFIDTPENNNNGGEVDISPPQEPSINLQMRVNSPQGSRGVRGDVDMMVWKAGLDDPYANFVGKYSQGGEISNVYSGNSISITEDSNDYYSADTGRYNGRVDLPAKNVDVRDRDSSFIYNLFEVTSGSNLGFEAYANNQELEKGEETEPENYEVEVGENTTKDFEVQFSQSDRGTYKTGIMFLRPMNSISEVNVTDISTSSGETIDYTVEEKEVEQAINLDGSMINGWKKVVKWNPRIVSSETLSVKLKAQSQNLPVEVDNSTVDYKMDGIMLQFRDYDHSSTISGTKYGYEVDGEDVGFQENLKQPHQGNTGLLIEAK